MEHEQDIAEEWRPIPGHSGYEASDMGRVRSWHKRGRTGNGMLVDPVVLRHRFVNGYPTVSLRRDSDGGRHHSISVHRCVLLAFVGPCPPGCEASHLNGVRSDARPTNLVWESRLANLLRKAEHGTAASSLTAENVTAIRLAVLGGETQTSQAEKYGITRAAASYICLGRSWAHVPMPAPLAPEMPWAHLGPTLFDALWRGRMVQVRHTGPGEAFATSRLPCGCRVRLRQTSAGPVLAPMIFGLGPCPHGDREPFEAPTLVAPTPASAAQGEEGAA